MSAETRSADRRAIEAVIERQFKSLSWTPDAPADWQAFTADFLPAAVLCPAARPASPQDVTAFVARMKQVAATKLTSLQERVLGAEITVFGNVALAAVGCELTENGAEVNRTVEMLLLVKHEGTWRILAQAWDTERSGGAVPEGLASAASPGSLIDRTWL